MATPPRLPPRMPPRARRGGRDRPSNPQAPRKPPRPRPPKRAARVTAEAIDAAFQHEVRPVRASVGYRLTALFAAGVVLLLPLAYLALIAAVGWGTYYHFTEHAGLLAAGRGRARVFAVLLYLAPGAAGAAVILALLKPLALTEGGRAQWRTLHRKTQPALFALIDRVCDAVDAPRPDRVLVDAQVNMSAGYQGGFLGLFGGKFVLTIGVPLAAGMSAAGFAGVLAHEFGHFAQRGGRGLSGAAMAVQSWLARTVYKRDRIDELIAEGSATLSWLSVPFWLCAACIWLARKALTALLYLSQTAMSALSRQMEFDADRYYTRLSGAEVFADSSRRVLELDAGFRGAMHELMPALVSGAPPEDLPALCVHHAPRLGEAEALKMEDEMRAGGGLWGRLFSSHPPTARRLDAARREGARMEATGGPALKLNGPAMDLFGDFPALCRDVTLDFYLGLMGRRPDPADLAPVRSLPPDPHCPRGAPPGASDKTSRGKKRRRGAAERPEPGGDGEFNPEEEERPARLLPYDRVAIEPPADESGHKARFAVRRKAATAAAEPLRQALAKLDKAGERRMKVFERLAGAGFAPAAHQEAGGDLFALQSKLERAERARDEAELSVLDLERAAADARLLALDLYAAPGVAAKLPGYVRTGIDDLLTFSEAVRGARPAIRELQDAAVRLTTALRAASGTAMFRGVRSEVEERTAALSAALAELNRKMLGLTDPFAVPLEVKHKPDAAARPFSARLNVPEAEDPVLLLSSTARCLRELRAAADHADRVLAARADWIAGRLKLN